jgi:periplasmic divalent cation tolerance protein
MLENMNQSAILVLTSFPDKAQAENLAHHLVKEGLAACVNILAPCNSVYAWQGKIEKNQEIPMLIKSSQSKYPELEQTILNHHPFELPEIISVQIDGYPPYLAWLAKHLD